jgi:hypothetical protein
MRVGQNVQTVLGLSMTSTSVGWVLLDGNDSHAAVLDHDAFDIVPTADSTIGETARHRAAVRGAQSIATASGHSISSVRVTWTEGIDADAKTFVQSLADLGFDNVLATPLSTAGQAWGLEAGRENEHTKTGICILEPDAATVMIVATGAGSVRLAITENRDSADDLIEWLRTVFRDDGWLPESLYLIGSRRDLDEVAGPIADALPIPVHDTVDAQLALARGAALASATGLATAAPVVATKRDRARQALPSRQPVDALATTVTRLPVGTIEPPARGSKQRPRPWLVAHAKKVAVSAAGVAVVGAALSLTAGSALNGENVAAHAAQAADPATQGAAVTSASIHPVSAPLAAPPGPAALPLAATPASPQAFAPEPVARAAEPVVAAVPQSTAVPVPQHTAAPPQRIATPAPPVAPLAAPAVLPAPAASPLGAPAPAGLVPAPAASPLGAPAPPAGVVPAPAPAAAPPVPAEPADQPPPPDPIQTLLSPLFSGLP